MAKLSGLTAGFPTSLAALTGTAINNTTDMTELLSGQNTLPGHGRLESNMDALFKRTFDKIPPVDTASAKPRQNTLPVEHMNKEIFFQKTLENISQTETKLSKADDEEFSSLIFNSPSRSHGRSVCQH